MEFEFRKSVNGKFAKFTSDIFSGFDNFFDDLSISRKLKLVSQKIKGQAKTVIFLISNFVTSARHPGMGKLIQSVQPLI